MSPLSIIKTKEDAIAAVDSIPAADGSEGEFLATAKSIVNARISALPNAVKIVGVEMRLDYGDIQSFSFRIIPQ